MASRSGRHGTRGLVSTETLVGFVDPDAPTSTPEDTEHDQGSQNESVEQVVVVEPKHVIVTQDATDAPVPQQVEEGKQKPINKIPRLEPVKESVTIDDGNEDVCKMHIPRYGEAAISGMEKKTRVPKRITFPNTHTAVFLKTTSRRLLGKPIPYL